MGRKMKEHNQEIATGHAAGVKYEVWRGRNDVKLYVYNARTCWIDAHKVRTAAGIGWLGCGNTPVGKNQDRIGIYAARTLSDTDATEAAKRMATEVRRQQDSAPSPEGSRLVDGITSVLREFATGATDSDQATEALLTLVTKETKP